MKDCNYTQRVGKRNDKDKPHTMLMIINVIIKHHKNTTNSRVLHDTESKSSFFVLLSMNIIIKRCLLSYEFLF